MAWMKCQYCGYQIWGALKLISHKNKHHRIEYLDEQIASYQQQIATLQRMIDNAYLMKRRWKETHNILEV